MRAGPWGRGYAVERRYTVDEPALPAEPIGPAAPPNRDAARGYYGDANVVRRGYRANDHESAYYGNGRHGGRHAVPGGDGARRDDPVADAPAHDGAPRRADDPRGGAEGSADRSPADRPLYGRRPGEVRGPVEGDSRLVGRGWFT